jgi:glutathione synthase/RimK-type ligase-like ATP-grasp enzyme
MSVSVSDETTQISYNGEELNLSALQAAWYRHPQLLGLDFPDKGKQMCIEQEITDLQESLWLMVPEDAWLNSPQNMVRAQSKLAQLAVARELGFSIPSTIVSNEWKAIDNQLGADDIIVKMSRGLLYEEDGTKAVYTTRLTPGLRGSLHSNSPFPGIFQTYETKRREWRITAVGDEFFDAAIYTDPGAKDDWRLHQLTDKVTFREENIGDEIHQLCRDYLDQHELDYGAFDFIENDEGKITFLECNSNGQFLWLEELLDMPISDAVVDTLMKKVVEAS